jgi:hypothetical protein
MAGYHSVKVCPYSASHQQLTPVTLATQEADQEDRSLRPGSGKQFTRPYLKKKGASGVA